MAASDPAVVTTDAARIDVGSFQVLSATGADRQAFLHRLLTTDIESLAMGAGTRALLLTLKGHIAVDFRVCRLAEEIRLVVPPGQAAEAVAALTKYAVMDDFAVAPKAGWRLVAVYGAKAEARLRQAGVDVPAGLAEGPRLGYAEAGFEGGGPLWLLAERGYGAPGVWAFGPEAAAGALEARLGTAGVETLEEGVAEGLRVDAGSPRFGIEITADYFPMEVGLSRAIDYGKGCYLGQEPIVRIRDRGHINWRLVKLAIAGGAPVAPGDRLESEAKPKAGRVTSVAEVPAGKVALAMAHVSVPVGAAVTVRHGEEAVTAQIVTEVEDP